MMENSKRITNKEEMFEENIDLLLVDTINYLKKLVSFKSYSEEEGEIIDYIEKTVGDLISFYGNDNVKVERINNSYLVEFDFGKEETLMLVGHVDIVHENDINKWSSDPFELNIVTGSGENIYKRNIDGKLVGRGTVDMKGFDALMLTMIKQLLIKESKYNIKLLFYDKEEIGDSGVNEMYEDGKLQKIVNNVNFVIVGEPTDSKVDNEVFSFLAGIVKMNGAGGHSSQINIKNTFYSQLGSLLERIQKIQDKYKKELVLNLTKITADNGSNNTVPSELQIGLNIRFSKAISLEQVKEEVLKELLDNLEFKKLVFNEGGYCPISIISKYLENIPTNSATYWSDIAILNKLVPAVNWGPGSIKQAHAYDETLLVKDMKDYINGLYKLLF